MIFDVDVNEADRVIDIKNKIKAEQGDCCVSEMLLILGEDVLKDQTTLSSIPVKDGETFLLMKHMKRGVMELCVEQIDDNTQWHGKHKFALRSKALSDEVEKIEVAVANFQDQGWGGCQARLFIYLYDPTIGDEPVATMKVFGPLRTAEYDERKHRRSPSCTIGQEEPVVALARPGMVYKLRYQCGGGGGHSISVKNWRCTIFPKARSTEEVTTRVSGTVQLNHRDRLGPDRSTGKWELQEPPFDPMGDHSSA